MNGDGPGLSKCWFGTIGSRQYSTFLPGFASAPSTAFVVFMACARCATSTCAPKRAPAK
ncbi:efflux transporter, RND family, MFP subunit domain protein [Burkholderia pseudomallei]|nr:efflux transporter, RND family, MFP subunit domain protein [Burkholderia pseudomallei]